MSGSWVWFGVIQCSLAKFSILLFSKLYFSMAFIGSHPTFVRTLLTMGECSLLLFLAIGQIQNVWHFEMLTLESMGKRLIVERNWQKLGLGVLQYTYGGYFWCLIPWVWFGVIQCTLQYFQFYNFKTILLSQFAFKLYAWYPNHGAKTGYYFFRDLPKNNNNKKIMAIWIFS